MEFLIFLLVNAALFLRPQDLVPSLAVIPIYNILIVINLIVASPTIWKQCRQGWKRAPATVCVLGIVAAAASSLLIRGELAGAGHWGLEFAKVAAYFLLITAVLTSTRRFVAYLAAVVVLTVILTGLATLHFHGQIELSSITHAREVAYDAETGVRTETMRLASFGVFGDPNDLSMIVVVSILICLGGISYRRLGLVRWALIVPLAFLAYVLALTQSRGGLLALMAGLSVFLVNRYGLLRSAVAVAALVPVLLVLFGGRQADLVGGISHGTGSGRTDLWYEGLQMLKWSPLTGVGQGNFVKEQGLVAHSSYMHALAEWGLIGGTFFIGLFYVVLLSVWRLKTAKRPLASPALQSLHPYVLGALAAYAASMLTLTRCDVVPTYLMAGLGVSYERLARRGTRLPPLTLTPALAGQMAMATIGFLLATYIYIRFVYRMFL